MAFFPRFVTDNGATFDNPNAKAAIYRYELWRRWDMERPILLFIMLNPSGANAVDNDRTINRCIDFAKRLGYGGIRVVNLFAYRSTVPDVLFTCKDPIGPDNDAYIRRNALDADRNGGAICLAWGKPLKPLWSRYEKVYHMLMDLGVPMHVLGTTEDGHPRHPLYLSAGCGLRLYTLRHV